jgi:hypothetical protein
MSDECKRSSFKSLNGLFLRTCSYEIIPPGINVRSVFLAYITDVTCSVKMTFKCIQPKRSSFSKILLVSCCWQFVISPPSVHLLIYPLHLIIRTVGNCALRRVFWFSVAYGGWFAMSANPDNHTVTLTFIAKCFYDNRLCTYIIGPLIA